jgi:hypothetical protein
MQNEALLKELRHLTDNLAAYPAGRGIYYVARLLHSVREIKADETRRIFEVYAQETDGRLFYSPFYILLGQDRAAIFYGASSEEPSSESAAVWLCLEHLLRQLPVGGQSPS